MNFKGNGLVWDKEKNKLLCKFENGKYETDDKREQKILDDLGYESDGYNDEIEDYKDLSASQLKRVNNDDLRAYLDKHEVEYTEDATKDDLIALIKGESDGE
ncbi:hypothetical protein [Virgibacillus halodenitrificans]|uniref:Rho termination factor N-terminal domain-containing protein n=1 Tax=Virgibacillus halodenitrificans TaxID=1482 RepID=A0ABR7VMZ9_VIRHA|nr:hypothetical protein [Virgibacillus halodenitrificans]MBD1223287.1 hypothetical protein [Virgibacillus halodenitrificans]